MGLSEKNLEPTKKESLASFFIGMAISLGSILFFYLCVYWPWLYKITKLEDLGGEGQLLEFLAFGRQAGALLSMSSFTGRLFTNIQHRISFLRVFTGILLTVLGLPFLLITFLSLGGIFGITINFNISGFFLAHLPWYSLWIEWGIYLVGFFIMCVGLGLIMRGWPCKKNEKQ